MLSRAHTTSYTSSISGNIWVYGALDEVETGDEDKTMLVKGKPVPNPNYCHPWVYWLAFFMITMVYVMLVLGFCVVCAVGCFVAKKASDAEQAPIVNNDEPAPTYTEEESL